MLHCASRHATLAFARCGIIAKGGVEIYRTPGDFYLHGRTVAIVPTGQLHSHMTSMVCDVVSCHFICTREIQQSAPRVRSPSGSGRIVFERPAANATLRARRAQNTRARSQRRASRGVSGIISCGTLSGVLRTGSPCGPGASSRPPGRSCPLVGRISAAAAPPGAAKGLDGPFWCRSSVEETASFLGWDWVTSLAGGPRAVL